MFEPSSEQKPQFDSSQLWQEPTFDESAQASALAADEAARHALNGMNPNNSDTHAAYIAAQNALAEAQKRASATMADMKRVDDLRLATQAHNEPLLAAKRRMEEQSTAAAMAGAASLATTAALWGGLADAAPSAAAAFGKTVEPHAMGMPIAIPLASVFTAIAAHPDKLAELMPAPTAESKVVPEPLENQATIAFPTGDVQPAPAPVMEQDYALQQSATAPATVPTNNGMQADGSMAEGQSTLPAPVRRPPAPQLALHYPAPAPSWAKKKDGSNSGNA